MQTNNYFEQTFEKQSSLSGKEYEGCTFNNCNFSNANFTSIKFIDCTFNACDLSLANVKNTALRNVAFKQCKLMGVQFDVCNTFNLALSFDHCVVNHSVFTGLKLKKTTFNHSQLHEVDFTSCDLTLAIFNTCDLSNTRFENTLLEQADFRTAYNYTIDPEINRVADAMFSLQEIMGLLHKYNIRIE